MPFPTQELSTPLKEDAIDMVGVSRILMRIFAQLEESTYTENQLRQTEVVVHPNLADPASDDDTPQGLVAL